MIDLFGIPNCDTVKKARKWLDAQGVDYAFHDYKKEGADPDKLAAWIAAKGLAAVLNKRGTTYRKLDDAEKAVFDGENPDSLGAVKLLVQHSSMIKRPIVECGVEYDNQILVGFKEDEWSAVFS